MIENKELKSCPCCGNYAIISTRGNKYTKSREASIRCVGCGLNIKVGAIVNSLDWCKDSVAKQWNNRMYDI